MFGLVMDAPNAVNTTRKEVDRKLDGVGPVDNRPSTDKLHHFVRRKKVTCDT